MADGPCSAQRLGTAYRVLALFSCRFDFRRVETGRDTAIEHPRRSSRASLRPSLRYNPCEHRKPTVLKRDQYRSFFYSGDRGEPPHIHVEREDRIAKF